MKVRGITCAVHVYHGQEGFVSAGDSCSCVCLCVFMKCVFVLPSCPEKKWKTNRLHIISLIKPNNKRMKLNCRKSCQ